MSKYLTDDRDDLGRPRIIREIDDSELASEKGFDSDQYLPTKDQFPTEEDLKRVIKGEKFHKIYKGKFYDKKGEEEKGVFRLREYFRKDPKKREILTVCFNAYKALVQKTARFFIGGKMDFIVNTSEEASIDKLQKEVNEIVKRNKFREMLQSAAISYQNQGYAAGNVFAEEGDAIIREIPYNENYPTFPLRGKQRERSIASYIEATKNGEEKKEILIYRQRFFLFPSYDLKWNKKSDTFDLIDKGDRLHIWHSLHTTKQLKADKKVQFIDYGLNEYAHFDIDPEEIVEIDFIPITQIDNFKLSGEHFGNSVVEDVEDLVEELQDSLTRLVSQLIKHLAAKLAVPRSSVATKTDPETGQKQVDFKALEIFFLESKEDPIPKYITNENPQIENAFKEIETILKMICVATETPTDFFGLNDKGGNEKVQAMKIRFSEFLRKIEDYQMTFKDFGEELLIMALKIKNIKLPDDFGISITYRDPLPRDLAEESNIHETAMRGGFESRKTAVRKFQKIDGEELEDEMARIEKDEESASDKFSF